MAWRGAWGVLLAVVRNHVGKYQCSGWGVMANPALGTPCGASGGRQPGVGSAGARRGEPASPRRATSPSGKPVARATSHTGLPPRDREPSDGKRGPGGLKWDNGI